MVNFMNWFYYHEFLSDLGQNFNKSADIFICQQHEVAVVSEVRDVVFYFYKSDCLFRALFD